jgi:hypothetical protein
LSLNREGRVPIIAILLDVGKYIYKSTVKLKEMALPQKLKVSPVFCDDWNTNLLYFSVNNSDWHLSSVYVTSPQCLYKGVWFLMGFYLISFELAKIQM